MALSPQLDHCPHLGLHWDRATTAQLPSEDHRCFAFRVTEVSLPYQADFCLGARFRECEVLGVESEGEVETRQSMRPLIFAALMPLLSFITAYVLASAGVV